MQKVQDFESFVKGYSIEDWVEVVQNSELLNKQGSIGDCKMRIITDEWCKHRPWMTHSRAMRSIMQEAYRQVALFCINAMEG